MSRYLSAALITSIIIYAVAILAEPIHNTTGLDDPQRSLQRLIFWLLALVATTLLWRDWKARQLGTTETTPCPSQRWQQLLPFLILAPAILYATIFTQATQLAMKVGDHDYTSISAAIAATARGEGILPTPYVDTGRSKSFLGHHFSPSLLLYLPAYLIALQLPPQLDLTILTTHRLYGQLLLLSYALGLLLWLEFARRLGLAHHTLVAFALILTLSFLPLRLLHSFHFEILALPLSAATLLALITRRHLAFAVTLALFCGIKEDLALYWIALGAMLLLFDYRRPDGLELLDSLQRRIVAWTLPLAALYMLFAYFEGRSLFAGELSPDWIGYWQPGELSVEPERRLLALRDVALSVGLLPLLSWRLLLPMAPVVLLHLISGHPWHATWYGHYGYSILPLLLLATTLTLRHWQIVRPRTALALLCLSLALVALSLAGDRNAPSTIAWSEVSENRDRREATMRLLADVAHGSCLQTSFPLSPPASISLELYPLRIPEGSPSARKMPGVAALRRIEGELDWRHATQSLPIGCSGYHLLIEPQRPLHPWYEAEDLKQFVRFSENALHESQRDGGVLLSTKAAVEQERDL